MSNDDCIEYNYDSNDLVDIKTIKFNEFSTPAEILEEHLSKIKNPYHFKSGNIEVEIVYADNNITVSQILRDYFIRNK